MDGLVDYVRRQVRQTTKDVIQLSNRYKVSFSSAVLFICFSLVFSRSNVQNAVQNIVFRTRVYRVFRPMSPCSGF